MKRKSIIIVIILMLVALSGFIILQMYWIRNAISIKEANFDRSVNSAVSDVIYKLEKLEVADRIRQQMYRNKRGTRLYNLIDSVNKAFNREIEQVRFDTSQTTQNIFNITSEKINVVVLKEHTGEIIKRYDTSIVTITKKGEPDNHFQLFSEGPASAFSQDSNSSRNIRHIESAIDQYLNRSSLVSDVFEDMFGMKYYDMVENRVNFMILDSLLSAGLRESGIATDYEFGVYSPLRNVMVSEKTGQYHRELLEKGYAFNLFPRDLFMAPEYLMIYFPKRDMYMLSKMVWVLSISGVLLIVMGGIFFITISSIIRQKRLSEMKNDFINNMTHEFKTPISSISLACEAISDPDVSAGVNSGGNYLRLIKEENQRLGVMAEKILQTAVLDKGQLELHYELIDLRRLLLVVINNFRIQIEAKGGEITTAFNAEEHYIRGDRTHLTNVFLNVLDNANKYSPVNPLISVETRTEPKGISVIIQDNGMGISKANQRKVFDKLYRVPTGNVHNVKGFGLGLHYVKMIVNRHGGAIGMQSELKNGTTVTIFLPYDNLKRMK
jgi:two-component system, OmpR family, phosphate regulon sensor histidine kinase PhoR